MLEALKALCLKAILPEEFHGAVVIDFGGGATDQLVTLCFARCLADNYPWAGAKPRIILNLHRKIWPHRTLRLGDARDEAFIRQLRPRRRSCDGSGRRLLQMGFELSALNLDWSFCKFSALPWIHHALYRMLGRRVVDTDRSILFSNGHPPSPPLLFNGSVGLDILESPGVAGFLATLRMAGAMSEANRSKLEQIENAPHPVCIHVRRGDYILHQGGRTLPAEYFHNAIKTVAATTRCENLDLFVFSDDLGWARKEINYHIPNVKTKVTFVDVNAISDPIPELWLMRACQVFIISTGRFGMLAAWLSTKRNKIIISPQNPPLSRECCAYSIVGLSVPDRTESAD